MAVTSMESQCVIQPRRLKDFLQDQNLPFPKSRKSTISVFIHAAVSSVKSSSILPRSISRRFSNRNRSLSRVAEPTMQRTTSVTVKDILRWKSFRDLAEINKVDQVENNVEDSPQCTTTTTTTTTGTPRSSSWCDSDFTVDDIEVTDKKNFHINIAGGERIIKDQKDRIIVVDEEEQFSPISVLDFTQQHEGAFSPFHQILANMERRNIMLKQQIQSFENPIEVDDLKKNVEIQDNESSFEIEEQAIRLMEHVKTTSSTEEWDLSLDCLLIDFFRDELVTNREVIKDNGELEARVLSVAKTWIRGEDDGSWTREVCVREMDRRLNGKDLEDDQKEIVIDMEKTMLNYLLDELVMDLVSV